MPEPRALAAPFAVPPPPPLWPETLPNPQADSISITGPSRVERSNVMIGPTRLRVHARTAPAQYEFACVFTAQQMQDFETWYTQVARDHDGEFYARWIGGSRVVAFIEPYRYAALGAHWQLNARVIRTRIDLSACDAFLSAAYGACYRDDGTLPDIYIDDGSADIYTDDFDLHYMVRNEC